MMPATCGNAPKSANDAPPLKSIKTKLTKSGLCVTARLIIIVRSNSLLPDPVAPMHRPCGPIPLSAASLKSIIRGSPSARTPSGTFSISKRSRARQVFASSNASAATIPSKSSRRTSCERSCCAPASASNKGAILRAMRSHILGSSPLAATPSERSPPRLISW